MSSGKQDIQPIANEEVANFEKAFQELAKGERTATALENQLSKMEARIQALLDQAEREQKDVQQLKSSASKAVAGDQAAEDHEQGKGSDS